MFQIMLEENCMLLCSIPCCTLGVSCAELILVNSRAIIARFLQSS